MGLNYTKYPLHERLPLLICHILSVCNWVASQKGEYCYRSLIVMLNILLSFIDKYYT